MKVQNLEEELMSQIYYYANQFGVEVDKTSLSTAFKTLLQNISLKSKPVVLLVDEYDKPIIDFLTEYEKAKANQDILRRFLGPLKGLESQKHLRFLFITGVSKFSKVSLFSDLNNLTDLTVSSLATDLLGITQEELETNFNSYIGSTVESFKLSKDELLQAIKKWYNGYSYDGETTLYNPFSILSFFNEKRFANYWFATGTPTFLVNTIRDHGIKPKELEGQDVGEAFFDKFSLKQLDMPGLLFQTGYLTIKSVHRRIFQTRYTLGYPNLEVRHSMMHNLVEAFTYKKPSVVSGALINMQRGLETGNVRLFIDQLTIILADIPYHWHPKDKQPDEETLFKMWEGYFHTIVYLVTSYMDMYVKAEVAHHKGRLDLIAQTDDFIYLMEFKLDGTTEDALAQIKEREYAASYRNSSKTVYLVGINFSRQDRNVESWDVKVWENE